MPEAEPPKELLGLPPPRPDSDSTSLVLNGAAVSLDVLGPVVVNEVAARSPLATLLRA